MNKQLLYGGATVSLIAIITYFNLTNIANWWVAKKDAQELKDFSPKKDTLTYYKNQFIVLMPTDRVRANLLKEKFNKLGFYQTHDCACASSFVLYENPQEDLAQAKLNSDPEDGPPDHLQFRQLKKASPDTVTDPYNFKGYTIIKNYKVIESVSREKLRKPFSEAIKRYPPLKPTSPEVIVATLDSGVDTTAPGIYASLYRNTSSSILCKKPNLEGIYGWNMLNRANDPIYAEPIATDEKCFSIFSVARGHGTLINGIIGGMGFYPNQVDFTNNIDVNLKLLNVKLFEKPLDNAPEIGLFDVLCGLNYAIDKKAKVINCSFHIPHGDITAALALSVFSEVLGKLKSSNAILVASAGNERLKNDPNLKIYPAAFSRDPNFGNNVIAVGSWNTITGLITESSNEGNFIDVYAPGKEIRMYNRLPHRNWWQRLFRFEEPESGTSFAAPFVAREAAIIIGQNPVNTASSVIKNALMVNSPPINGVNVFKPIR
jgi:subtilisin family serine protease